MKIYTEFYLLISKNLLYCMNNKDRTVSEDDLTWVWIGFNSKWNWWMLNHIWQANYPCLRIKWIRIKWAGAHNAADTCQQQKLKWMGPEEVVSTKILTKGSFLWTKEEHTITAQTIQTRVYISYIKSSFLTTCSSQQYFFMGHTFNSSVHVQQKMQM